MAIASVELQQDYLLLRQVETDIHACVYEVAAHGPDVGLPAGSFVVLNENVLRSKLKVADEVFELTSIRTVVGVVELVSAQSA